MIIGRAPGVRQETREEAVRNSGLPDGVLARPRAFGEIGGGALYAANLFLRRDRRRVLEPAPVGALLDGEIARSRKEVAARDRGMKRSLEQLEASMTPAAKAARRPLRAGRRKARYRAPDSMTRELDNADKSDAADCQRRKEGSSPPAAWSLRGQPVESQSGTRENGPRCVVSTRAAESA